MRTRTLAGAAASAFALSLLATTPALAGDGGRPGGTRDLTVDTARDTRDARPGDGVCADTSGSS